MRKMFNENLHMCLLGIPSSGVEEMTLWLKVMLHTKKIPRKSIFRVQLRFNFSKFNDSVFYEIFCRVAMNFDFLKVR